MNEGAVMSHGRKLLKVFWFNHFEGRNIILYEMAHPLSYASVHILGSPVVQSSDDSAWTKHFMSPGIRGLPLSFPISQAHNMNFSAFHSISRGECWYAFLEILDRNESHRVICVRQKLRWACTSGQIPRRPYEKALDLLVTQRTHSEL